MCPLRRETWPFPRAADLPGGRVVAPRGLSLLVSALSLSDLHCGSHFIDWEGKYQ